MSLLVTDSTAQLVGHLLLSGFWKLLSKCHLLFSAQFPGEISPAFLVVCFKLWKQITIAVIKINQFCCGRSMANDNWQKRQHTEKMYSCVAFTLKNSCRKFGSCCLLKIVNLSKAPDHRFLLRKWSPCSATLILDTAKQPDNRHSRTASFGWWFSQLFANAVEFCSLKNRIQSFGSSDD